MIQINCAEGEISPANGVKFHTCAGDHGNLREREQEAGCLNGKSDDQRREIPELQKEGKKNTGCSDPVFQEKVPGT
ncbi:MAG: hypothetical protein SPL41_10400 [Succinivibrionaceae bacterium]|jgi:hypothetical protein|nr:hypothetical protein [Pseudomonadota bacterium]MDY6275416.1 hypothetical protein [Succinivibrionaceae bacterium]MDY6375205.1 hypothetical protein [Succinivibrionaceae bacterium]